MAQNVVGNIYPGPPGSIAQVRRSSGCFRRIVGIWLIALSVSSAAAILVTPRSEQMGAATPGEFLSLSVETQSIFSNTDGMLRYRADTTGVTLAGSEIHEDESFAAVPSYIVSEDNLIFYRKSASLLRGGPLVANKMTE